MGRSADVAHVVALLRRNDVRLVTLTGARGVGKTRLGLAVAAELGSAFPDGVAFVSLASIADPALVPVALARVIGVRETADRSLLDGIVAYLRTRRLLVLLDNFEHLLSASPLLADLLAACPSLSLLVTSRSLLHLRPEHRFDVAPLDLPPLHGPAGPADVTASPAVALFLARAQASQPAFAITSENAADVAAICRRLDGLPLAIELAATRTTLLSPAALLARLEHCLGMLVGGARDLPERQQTMRAAIGWSYDLLHPGEKALLRRLAVFAGGCTLEAVEGVCPAGMGLEADVLGWLEELVDKILLQRLTSASEPRVGMLETVREFALEQLAAAGELGSAVSSMACPPCVSSEGSAVPLPFCHRVWPHPRLATRQTGWVTGRLSGRVSLSVSWENATSHRETTASSWCREYLLAAPIVGWAETLHWTQSGRRSATSEVFVTTAEAAAPPETS